MSDRKLKEKLRNSLTQEVQPERLKETIQLCTEMMLKQRGYREEPRTGFWRFLSEVFRFEGLTLLGLQSMVLFIAFIGIGSIAGDPRYIPAFIPLFALAVMPVLIRSQFYGMSEIEAVTRASGAQIILAKLILAGAVNLIGMTALLFFEACLQNSYANMGQMVLYCLVPYLLCMTAMLRIIRLRKKEKIPVCAAGISGSCLYWGILADKLPELYEMSAMGIWIMALLVFGGFFIKEIYFIVETGKEGKQYGIIG